MCVWFLFCLCQGLVTFNGLIFIFPNACIFMYSFCIPDNCSEYASKSNIEVDGINEDTCLLPTSQAGAKAWSYARVDSGVNPMGLSGICCWVSTFAKGVGWVSREGCRYQAKGKCFICWGRSSRLPNSFPGGQVPSLQALPDQILHVICLPLSRGCQVDWLIWRCDGPGETPTHGVQAGQPR